MSTLARLVELPQKPGAKKPEPPQTIREGDYEVAIQPYHGDNDPNSWQMLPWLWKRLKDDGLLDLYYPQESDKSFCTFAKMLSAPVTRVILVVLRNPNDPTDVKDIIGFATWEPLRMGPAALGHAGFIFLKKFWDRQTSVEAGERIMDWWFANDEDHLDLAVGLIAEKNVLANRFVQRLGWKKSTILPGCQQWAGEQCDAVLWQVTRKEWESKKG